jgi:Kef-type K+ transport system membrane component KefB
MEQVWLTAALWLILALAATLLSIWFRISTALSEIVVGTVAQLLIGALIGTVALGAKSAWINFLAGTGAIVLTFLAGAELDPAIFRTKWKEAFSVGLVGFFAPFLGAAAVAHLVLGWSISSSWLAGVALSTTSVAVVYAVHARTRLEPNGIRQRDSLGLLYQRSRHGNRARPDLRAVHDPHTDLRDGQCCRVRDSTVRHPVVLRTF